MNSKYVAPKKDLKAFNCPFCGAYAHMIWVDATFYINKDTSFVRGMDHDIVGARCSKCQKISLWNEDKMVFPSSSTVEIPNEDMPESVQELYNEAREIVNKSPRGAAALLRLALDKLCDEVCLDCKTKRNINEKIKLLVEYGLPKRLQQAFDFVRVTGNDAVHDLGSINIQDNHEIATALFGLLNLIVEKMITEDNQINEYYNSIPQNLRDSIEKRDNKAKGTENA